MPAQPLAPLDRELPSGRRRSDEPHVGWHQSSMDLGSGLLVKTLPWSALPEELIAELLHVRRMFGRLEGE